MTATIIELRPLVALGRERVPGAHETRAPGTHQTLRVGGHPSEGLLPELSEDDRAYLRWVLRDLYDDVRFSTYDGAHNAPA